MRLACVGRVCEVVAAELPILRACGTAPYAAASAEPRAQPVAEIVREPVRLCSPYATLTVTADARTGLPRVAVAQCAAPPAQLQCAALDRLYTAALRDGAPAFFARTRQLVAHHEALMRCIDEAVGAAGPAAAATLEPVDVLRAIFHMYADILASHKNDDGNEDNDDDYNDDEYNNNNKKKNKKMKKEEKEEQKEGKEQIEEKHEDRAIIKAMATPTGVSVAFMRTPELVGRGWREWGAAVELEPRTVPKVAARAGADPAARQQLAQCYPPGLGVLLETHAFVLALGRAVPATQHQLVHLLEHAYPRFSAEAYRRHYVPPFGPPLLSQTLQQQQQQHDATQDGMYERQVCGLGKTDEIVALHTGPGGAMRATLAVPAGAPVFATARLPYVPSTAAATVAALQRIIAYNQLLESCFRPSAPTSSDEEAPEIDVATMEVSLARYCTADATAPYVLDVTVRCGARAHTLTIAVGLGARVCVTLGGGSTPDSTALAARLTETAWRTLSVPQVVTALLTNAAPG